jgi:hypothetical protein
MREPEWRRRNKGRKWPFPQSPSGAIQHRFDVMRGTQGWMKSRGRPWCSTTPGDGDSAPAGRRPGRPRLRSRPSHVRRKRSSRRSAQVSRDGRGHGRVQPGRPARARDGSRRPGPGSPEERHGAMPPAAVPATSGTPPRGLPNSRPIDNRARRPRRRQWAARRRDRPHEVPSRGARAGTVGGAVTVP